MRCGLILEEHLRDVDIAVATGRGLLQGQLPIGEAIDRALELLKDSPQAPGAPRGVWLDVLTADLLAGRLRIERANGRARVVREQDASSGEDVRRLLGQSTPCVGREQELATLESILSTCIGDSVARAAGVMAPPGMGKSRLRHEFLRRAASRHPELLVVLGRGEIGRVGGAPCRARSSSYGCVPAGSKMPGCARAIWRASRTGSLWTWRGARLAPVDVHVRTWVWPTSRWELASAGHPGGAPGCIMGGTERCVTGVVQDGGTP